ncbi:MAG: hypothetical protein ACNI3C_00760 [Candidatus Marinarcus sp.]|uniref:hypothetical protein n=1 Tax=Candidatus Marinarcus sp. TaxID=3100987 RepID=UPI003AFF8EF5
MKRSVALLELIFSIFILSIVMVFSLKFYHQIQKRNGQEFLQTLDELKLQSTEIFLYNILKTSRNIHANGSVIHFYKLDNEAFLQGYYSGVALLDRSDKEKIYTPFSQTVLLTSHYILFDQNQLHEIKPSSENNLIYFKNQETAKTIYEHYEIVKSLSSFSLKEETLYYDDQMLLEEVTAFHPLVQNNQLKLDICLKQLCQKWSFPL